MNNTNKYRNRLITLLKELFQLDQPELDFGLYKIMHAKSVQITRFLENDLLKEIQHAFGEKDQVDAAQLKANATEKLKAALGEEALDERGQLNPIYANTPAGKAYLQQIASAEAAKDTLNAEAEVYDHLYRFFERYYDSGDFMSRRYYARESDSRAAPYAVPYDGREVYLHWANKDQYYIKSSEYLTNYTFELNAAIAQEADRQKRENDKNVALDLGGAISDKPQKVHFRIVSASEGEHGNIKAGNDQKRFFIIHADEPVKIENGELIIQFQYRNDPEKSGQDKTWQESLLNQAETRIYDVLKALPDGKGFIHGLTLPAPTDSKKDRTLLGKHLQKYSTRNTMDYFIHKDLGSFLRRELDFYIKNEIMRLDDIENSEAPKVEQYLGKIKVLRRIAHQLIAFLAQLENFQKKLWLKKKFVTETQYCITLDRIPESFYPEIAANEKQREEWVKLFAINEIKGDLAAPGYSVPLTVEFLKANPFLLIDTVLFDDLFKMRLLNEIQEFDKQCEGVLVHSENFQALNLLRQRYAAQVKCIYIDPPYNTGEDGFVYRDGYADSTWLACMEARLKISEHFFSQDWPSIWINIDDNEGHNLKILCDSVFGKDRFIAANIWQKRYSRENREAIGDVHDYIFTYAPYPQAFKVSRNKVEITERQAKVYTNTNDDPKGRWRTIPLTAQAGHATKDQFYEIKAPGGKVHTPPQGRCWGISKSTYEKYLAEGRIYFGQDNNSQPNLIRYLSEVDGITPWTWWPHEEVGHTDESKKELYSLLGKETGFDTPKPVRLMKRIIGIASDSNSTILDYFAGSGTTGEATITLNRQDNGKRKYILVEMGDYFDSVLKSRVLKALYSDSWKEGRPEYRVSGISGCFKCCRLESYEDALNNLILKQDESRNAALENHQNLKRDYLLNYFLDVETEGSQSLLNIADFRDPTGYKMWIKKPGSEEQTLQTIDLIETFNWLIGLWVDHLAAPQTFDAEFVREKDKDLPEDQNTRLVCTRLKRDDKGAYWFRLVEGYTLRVPGDNTSKVPTLIIWRKLTDDAEKHNAALQKYLEVIKVSTREKTYEVIYVNGSHTLPNPVVEGEHTKVRLIEEAFHQAMWAEV